MALPLRFPLLPVLAAALSGTFFGSAFATPPELKNPLALENGSFRVTQNIPVGKALVLPLLASDADGDLLEFTVASSNPKIMARVRTGCPILKVHVSYAGDPNHLDGAGQPAPVDAIEGDMEFQLFRDATPLASGNIGGAAQAGFFDGLVLHRVLAGFVIQGGDPTGTGGGDPGFSFDHEFVPELIFSGRGQLAMANSNGGFDRGKELGSGFVQLGNFDPTNSSQFFVTVAQPRHLDFKHTIFGQLIRGFDVLDKVSVVPGNTAGKPTVPVKMTTVSLTPGRTDATLLLTATDAGDATLTVVAKDGNGGKAVQSFTVSARKDHTNDPPLLRPVPNILTPVGVQPSLGLRGFDLEHDYLLYGIATASGNSASGSFGAPQISGSFSPRKVAGAQTFAVGVAGYNDPTRNAASTPTNAFAPFDAYHFRVAELGYGDRAIKASASPVEGTAATAMTGVILAEFRDGDPAGVPLDYVGTVNWGDGSAQESTTALTPTIKIERSAVTPGSFVVKGTHTYAKSGVYPIETIMDGKLGAVARTHSQAVISASAATLRAVGLDVENTGATVNDRVLATFSDSTSGTLPGDYTARIDWGDGAVSVGGIVPNGTGRFAITGKHTYLDAQTFAVHVHLDRSAPSPAHAVAWSRVNAYGFAAPQHLPPFPAAHLVAQITAAASPFNTTTGAGATAETKFAISIVVLNSGDIPSKAGKVRFYLSKDETFDASDIPLLIGTFPEGNLPVLKAGAGLRYNLTPTTGSDGKPLDLRLVAPKGQNGASYFVLAHLDYSDPLADQLPILKDVVFGRINGITVSRTALTVTEAAGAKHSRSFTVVLQGKPAADVKLATTLSVSTRLQIDQPQLIFTKQNWNVPQTVTVTAIDDMTHQGTTTSTVNIGPSVSTDDSWNGMTASSVTVSIEDNDPAP